MSAKTFKHNGETFTVGEQVECEVAWKNGRKTVMRGVLITIAGDEVFIESELGPVSGSLDSLEKTS